MAFSKFLDSRREACKQLTSLLKDKFAYVSILGCDVKTTSVRVNKRTSNVGEGSGTDCGFVVKMSDGKAFFEYSLDDITGNISALAEKISSAVALDEELKKLAVSTAVVDDEPLVRSFARESDFDDYSEEAILDVCTRIKDELLSKSEFILNGAVILNTLDVSKLFITQNRMLDQNYTWVNGYLVVNYRENDKMVSARESVDARNIGDVLSALPTRIDRLVNKAHMLTFAKPIEPGEYDVITDPSITGLLAHEAFGHGVEMDMFVKDRALAKHCIGTQVASTICNMHDGAAAAQSVASYFFDDDGVPAHDTQIIKDGILVRGISDLVSASELGVAPTGNGRRQDHTRKSYTRMTNTFFEAGKDRLEDMIKSVKHGYMIFETNNGMEDPKNWQIQCVAEYGREIIDGNLTDNYVSPVVMSGYVPDVLRSISMISTDLDIEGAGQCGKGHKEWVRVSDGGPALKLRVRLG